jgi:hypothetical protein
MSVASVKSIIVVKIGIVSVIKKKGIIIVRRKPNGIYAPESLRVVAEIYHSLFFSF